MVNIAAPRKAENMMLKRSDGRLSIDAHIIPRLIVKKMISRALINLFCIKIFLDSNCQSIIKLSIVDNKEDKPIVV